MNKSHLSTPAGNMCFATVVSVAILIGSTVVTAAEAVRRSPDTQIQHAAHTIWLKGANDQRLCATIVITEPEQSGVQGLAQNFVPGQWAVRVAKTRLEDIARLDYLTQFGLLERTEQSYNIGPISIAPASEYRSTVAGWVQSSQDAGQATFPCFYYGRRGKLDVIDYTETEKDSDGYSTVKINFTIGVSEIEKWAADPAASELFPEIRQAQKGQASSWTFVRAPNNKLKITRDHPEYIDDMTTPSRVSPGIDAVREAVASAHASDASRIEQKKTMPMACFPMLPSDWDQFWRVGDKQAATQARFVYSNRKHGTGLPNEEATYMRLVQLQAAGLLRLKDDPRHKQVLVRPAKAIQSLLSEHGNCLPLGSTRLEVAGMQGAGIHRDSRIFKARHIVEKPASWIRAIPKNKVPPDLAAVLRHGQAFRGTAFSAEMLSQRVAYVVEERPLLVQPTLDGIGVSQFWRDVTDKQIQSANVKTNEVHWISFSTPNSGGGSDTVVDVDVLPGNRPVIIVLVNDGDRVTWRFKVHPKAHVRAVVATGEFEQQVTGLPSGVALVIANSDSGRRDLRPTRTVDTRGFSSRPTTLQLGNALKIQDLQNTVRVVVGPGRGKSK